MTAAESAAPLIEELFCEGQPLAHVLAAGGENGWSRDDVMAVLRDRQWDLDPSGRLPRSKRTTLPRGLRGLPPLVRVDRPRQQGRGLQPSQPPVPAMPPIGPWPEPAPQPRLVVRQEPVGESYHLVDSDDRCTDECPGCSGPSADEREALPGLGLADGQAETGADEDPDVAVADGGELQVAVLPVDGGRLGELEEIDGVGEIAVVEQLEGDAGVVHLDHETTSSAGQSPDAERGGVPPTVEEDVEGGAPDAPAAPPVTDLVDLPLADWELELLAPAVNPEAWQWDPVERCYVHYDEETPPVATRPSVDVLQLGLEHPHPAVRAKAQLVAKAVDALCTALARHRA